MRIDLIQSSWSLCSRLNAPVSRSSLAIVPAALASGQDPVTVEELRKKNVELEERLQELERRVLGDDDGTYSEESEDTGLVFGYGEVSATLQLFGNIDFHTVTLRRVDHIQRNEGGPL